MEKNANASAVLLVAYLLEKGITLCTAESCTGGMIASRIVSVSGASSVFPGSLVSYATRVKEQLLCVSPDSVEKHTVVSLPVAEQMAKGALALLGADIAVSVTGLAGPGGGTEEIPVGRVFIGYASREAVRVEEFTFEGDRQRVRECAAEAALLGALAFAEQYYG